MKKSAEVCHERKEKAVGIRSDPYVFIPTSGARPSFAMDTDDYDVDSEDSIGITKSDTQIARKFRRYHAYLSKKNNVSPFTRIRILSEMNAMCEEMEDEYRRSVSDTTVDKTDGLILSYIIHFSHFFCRLSHRNI